MTGRLTLEDANTAAAKRGGRCLCPSSDWRGREYPVEWKCGVESHPVWRTTLKSIKSGRWCRHCYTDSLKLDGLAIARHLAVQQGGACLSEVYVKNTQPLEWQCSECDHIWRAALCDAQRGSWCPSCAGNIRYTLEDCHQLARRRDGRCSSTEYADVRTHLGWVCAKGHTWSATWANVNTGGTWCPQCPTSTGETICRAALEAIFCSPFKPTRQLDWLRANATRLELDCYSEHWQLACEYNGEQHYKYNPHFHRSKAAFTAQEVRDTVKAELCADNGICLITVPFTVDAHIKNRQKRAAKVAEFVWNAVQDLGYPPNSIAGFAKVLKDVQAKCN